jgi:two-component system cell cycle sensor histidine kinase/response regulator CckA
MSTPPPLARRLRRLGDAFLPTLTHIQTDPGHAAQAISATAAAIAVAWSALADTHRDWQIALVALPCLALFPLSPFLARRAAKLLPGAVGLVLAAVASVGIALFPQEADDGVLVFFLAALFIAYHGSPRDVLRQVLLSSAGLLAASLSYEARLASLFDWLAFSVTLAAFSSTIHVYRRRSQAQVLDLGVQARQQHALARLSGHALDEADPLRLMERAVELVAKTLHAHDAIVLELLPSHEGLVPRAHFGPAEHRWAGGLDLGPDSLCRYAMLAGEPVTSADLETEGRFDVTPLQKTGLEAVAAVTIPGRKRPFGVLSVAARERRDFPQADVDFLQAAANVIGSAVERQRDERSLRQARNEAVEAGERFRTLIEIAPIAITEIDLEGNVTLWNRAAEEMFGWDRDEVLGHKHPGLPEDREGEPLEVLALLRAGEPLTALETVRRRRDGSEFPYSLHVAGRRDPQGNLVAMVGLGVDISEPHLAQQELSRSRELYRVVVENSHDMIALLDGMGRFMFASPSYERALGYSPAELVGVSPISLVHPSDVQRASDALRRVVTDHATAVFELRMRHKRGSWVHVEGTTTAVVDDDGALQSILIAVRDISERRIAEEELREAEARYRLLVEQLPLVTYINTPGERGRWVYLSPQLEDILGYTKEEWISDPSVYVNALHADDRERVLAERALSAGKGRIASEYRLQAKDGRTVWVRDEAVVQRDLSGKPLYIQGYLLDISPEREADLERKRLETQLLHSQKMEAIGRLAGGIAHDFNNLLTAITGYSELIVSDLDPESPLARDAEEIKRAAEQAAAMTQQLLAFSRRQVLQPQLMNLNEVVTQIQKMLKRLIGEDIDLVMDLAPELETIRSDRAQIEQVFMNLVVNARDAMPPLKGGRVTIRTANASLIEPEASELGAQPGDYVLLTVSDTGEGMDGETLAHIFEPFFTTKEQGKGTGLGLSTVHGIVEQSGGVIKVESHPGSGTSFHVYLPVVVEQTDVSIAVPPLAEMRGNETLLLVEDEEMVRQLVGRVLRESGYDVYEASSGEDALRLSDDISEEIDLLVTDVVMPGMSGRVLAEQLSRRRPRTRVLFMSGYTEEAIVDHGVVDGEADFISKPFTPQELAQKIRNLLDAERAEHTAA